MDWRFADATISSHMVHDSMSQTCKSSFKHFYSFLYVFLLKDSQLTLKTLSITLGQPLRITPVEICKKKKNSNEEVGVAHAQRQDLLVLKRNLPIKRYSLDCKMLFLSAACWSGLETWHLAVSAARKVTPLKQILQKILTGQNHRLWTYHPPKMTTIFQRLIWEMRLFSNSPGRYFLVRE